MSRITVKCQGHKASGTPCHNPAVEGYGGYCHFHRAQSVHTQTSPAGSEGEEPGGEERLLDITAATPALDAGERIDTLILDRDSSAVEEALAEQRRVEAEYARKKAAWLEKQRLYLKAQQERLRDPEKRRREPAPAPVFARDAGIDQSIILDHDGRPAGTPGTIKRHVRCVNSQDRESSERINSLQVAGYQFCKSRLTGRPIRTQFGMAMEISPDREAERVAAQEARVSTKVDSAEAATLDELSGYQGVQITSHHRREHGPGR